MLEGEVSMGSQYHFYLENQVCSVYALCHFQFKNQVHSIFTGICYFHLENLVHLILSVFFFKPL